MGCYKVNFGDYCLAHYDDLKYFDYFEFNGKKYSIGAPVKLTPKGMEKMFHNGRYDYKKGDFRLVDHFIDDHGIERWEYIIGWLHSSCKIPVFYLTNLKPEELVSDVVWSPINEAVHTPGELQVEFKESKYFPKDWEVEGVMSGWFVMVLIWIVAFIFKDWWITLLVQICAGVYFGSWRENKINEAISTQKFKE